MSAPHAAETTVGWKPWILLDDQVDVAHQLLLVGLTDGYGFCSILHLDDHCIVLNYIDAAGIHNVRPVHPW